MKSARVIYAQYTDTPITAAVCHSTHAAGIHLPIFLSIVTDYCVVMVWICKFDYFHLLNVIRLSYKTASFRIQALLFASIGWNFANQDFEQKYMDSHQFM